MVALLLLWLNLLGLPFKSKGRLAAENAALRQQVIVLQRKVRGRIAFTNSDRLFFIQLYRWFPSVSECYPDHSARDPGALASRGLSAVLALEVSQSWRSAADRCGSARPDPADEH
jgi:hypothetical protein